MYPLFNFWQIDLMVLKFRLFWVKIGLRWCQVWLLLVWRTFCFGLFWDTLYHFYISDKEMQFDLWFSYFSRRFFLGQSGRIGQDFLARNWPLVALDYIMFVNTIFIVIISDVSDIGGYFWTIPSRCRSGGPDCVQCSAVQCSAVKCNAVQFGGPDCV
jgi:hypothetical protein